LLTVVDWSPFGIDKRNIAFDGKMAYTSNVVYTVAYNNKLAKEADAPKNWADILDERYRGKGVSSAFLLPRLIGGLGLAWGEDKALQFARDIVAKMNLLLTRAPRESLLQSGERLYAFGEIDSLIRTVAAEGLPVSQVVPQPVVVGQFGATIMKNAPHPNAARLFMEFLLGPEFNEILVKARYESMRADVKPLPGAKSITEVKIIRPTLDETTKGIPAVAELWRDVFGQ
jgi:iron(III) transport system substrate-binding protein